MLGGDTMRMLLSVLIGYMLGCVNPARFFAGRKGVDLRQEGTGNLGTTNTVLVMGKSWGLLVLLIDMGKAILSAKIAKWLFPKLVIAGMLAAFGAILGHIFPYHMGFHGGKGLACFGGMVLEYNPLVFLVLLTIGLVAAVIVNFGVCLPVSAAILFPVAVGLVSRDLASVLAALAASVVILVAHRDNIARSLKGDDLRVRDWIRSQFCHSN